VLLDVLKGFVPALVGVLLVSHLVGILAGSLAMLGHWRPLFLRFEKGGKMVATCGGVLFGVAWLVGLSGLAVWIVVFLLSRYASLASILAALALPVLAFVFGEPNSVILFSAAAGAGVVLLHRANLKRLRMGTESRFHFRRAASA
jgi:glycerol-3-phosphate acyltransferase PlsY